MMSKNKIKEGAKLKHGYKIYNYVKDYTENEDCSFVSKEDDRTELLEDNELITTDFLNSEVELIPPVEKKYYLKLNIDDKEYVSLNCFTEKAYSFWRKELPGIFKTKFTQVEIDNDKFLKFVEEHGVKEEVKNDEND